MYDQQKRPNIEELASKVTQDSLVCLTPVNRTFTQAYNKSLQMYIRRLNWSQPKQVAEAYTLLNNFKSAYCFAITIPIPELLLTHTVGI